MSSETTISAKEAAYDEHIFPLMDRIIELCKEHKINMAASFSLDPEHNDGPMFCTTVLAIDKSDAPGFKRAKDAERLFYPKSDFYSVTITKGGTP